MSTPPAPGRRLAAVWFADIVGYTALSSRDEDAALAVVAVFQRIAEEVVSQHSGRVVKYIGDAALAEFASTDGAIRSALVLMERFLGDEVARRHDATLRVGVNVGEVISSSDGDIYGDGVNMASRLQNQAAPGQVIASEAVHAQIRQRPVFRTEPLGQRTVKGVTGLVTLYAVSLQIGEPSTSSPPPPPTTGGSGLSAPSRKRTMRTAGIAAGVVLIAALVTLDPGGVIGRMTAGEASGELRASYPVVEGGMEVAAPITLTFRSAVDPTTATSANVQLLDAAGDAVPAEVSLGDDQSTLVLRPRAPLAYAARYSLVVAEALLGARGEVLGSPPVAIRTQPVPADAESAVASVPATVGTREPVRVALTEALARDAVEGGGVRLTDARGTLVEAAVAISGDGRSVTLTPGQPLSAGARYRVGIDSTVLTVAGLGVTPDTLWFHVGGAAPTSARPATTTGSPEAAPKESTGSAGGARSGPATFNITASPSAALPYLKVVVNGDTLGPPPQTGVSVAEGRTHTVTLVGVPELSSYSLVVFSREVAAQPGQAVDVAAQITAFGSIDIVSEPAGTVFVDGRQVGRTPLAGYPVTAGVVHRLEIRPTPADAARFSPYRGEFRVEPLEWKSLGRVTLPPAGGGR